MEQKIHFCTTTEGVNLAYSILGEGPVIVIPPAWISHIKLDWESPKTRSYLEKLASHHSVIRYDKHGCGLSDRDRKDFTLEKEVSNLEAIINHLELPRLALFGYSQSGPISIAYAAKYPERVSHLILYGTYARGIDTRTPELAASLASLVRASWGLGSKTLADRYVPGADKAGLEYFARYQREAATGEMAARLLELTNNLDVTDLLPKITTPTIVIHRQEDEVAPVQFGRQLAVSIPNARLVLLEGKDHVPGFGDSEGILRAVAEFLDPDDVAPIEKSGGKSLKEEGFKRKLAAILSADVQEYSRLMNDDEDETISTLSNYREAMTTLIQKHRGRVVDSTGDNLLAEFTSVRDAVQCAVVIQHELKAKNDKLSENRRMEFRIGINLGDVVEDGDRIYGDGVNLAARIESLAEGGGICISGTVFDQIENKLSLGYEYLGEKRVKNIPKAVRVYQIKKDLEDGPSKVKGDNKVHRIY
jgi:class 3 adenylate cyclase